MSPDERSSLIQRAASFPKGSVERREILAGLKQANTVVIPVPFPAESGQTFEELGLSYGNPEEDAGDGLEDTQRNVLSYLGKRRSEDIQVIGGEGANLELLRAAWKKGRTLGPILGDFGNDEAVAGTLGRIKAVMVPSYHTVWMI